MLSYSLSALRRLRPQGWQSQTPSVGQAQIFCLRVSVAVGRGMDGDWDVERFDAEETSCAGIGGVVRPEMR